MVSGFQEASGSFARRLKSVLSPEPDSDDDMPAPTPRRMNTRQRVHFKGSDSSSDEDADGDEDEDDHEEQGEDEDSVTPIEISTYQSAADITYTPDAVFREGLMMVSRIRRCLREHPIGSKLRHTLWDGDMQKLKDSTFPKTYIAVCGATGTGKSSLLNALLDRMIIPTSGAAACTACVTEISFHQAATIDANIKFLPADEWLNDISILLDGLKDENGGFQAIESKTAMDVLWQKVHAVYPNISQEAAFTMSAQQVMDSDEDVKSILGTAKQISCSNSKIFGKAIKPFIASKAQRGSSQQKALWPLILKVAIQCDSPALASGAVLVDLPGIADVNAARNSIAKSYMAKADCIWVLAPITRAVDDRVAHELMGDAFKTQIMNGKYHAITFIATKCDDIMVSEIIDSLDLEQDPQYIHIKGELKACSISIKEWKKKAVEADQLISELTTLLNQLENLYPAGVKVENTEVSVMLPPELGAHFKQMVKSTKRSRLHDDCRVVKRRCISLDYGLDDQESSSDELTPLPSDQEDEAESEQETEISVGQLYETRQQLQKDLEKAQAVSLEAKQMDVSLNHKLQDLGSKRDTFCAQKRSESSIKSLKEDFMKGVQEFDNNSNDEQNYDVPVFACSSKDYICLQKLVDNSSPKCFSTIEDTGIPQLQQWCHALTSTTQHIAAHKFLCLIRSHMSSIITYVNRTGNSTAFQDDRSLLKDRWECIIPDSSIAQLCPNTLRTRRFLHHLSQSGIPNGNQSGNLGVSLCLIKDFKNATIDYIHQLRKHFWNSLEEQIWLGAETAASKVLKVSDNFAKSTPWQTYRSTIARNGVWHKDLNALLAQSFLATIATNWGLVFGSDLLAPFKADVLGIVNALLAKIKTMEVSEDFNELVQDQAEICLQETVLLLDQILQEAHKIIKDLQTEASRFIPTYVQQFLATTYTAASQEFGSGSHARRKKRMHVFIDRNQDHIFEKLTNTLLRDFGNIAEEVGQFLDRELLVLSTKVELSIASLWEQQHLNPTQLADREDTISTITKILDQVNLWVEAEGLVGHTAKSL